MSQRPDGQTVIFDIHMSEYLQFTGEKGNQFVDYGKLTSGKEYCKFTYFTIQYLQRYISEVYFALSDDRTFTYTFEYEHTAESVDEDATASVGEKPRAWHEAPVSKMCRRGRISHRDHREF